MLNNLIVKRMQSTFFDYGDGIIMVVIKNQFDFFVLFFIISYDPKAQRNASEKWQMLYL
jgi:hypothetical protein